MKPVLISILFIFWGIWSVICYLSIGMFETFGSYFYRIYNSNLSVILHDIPKIVGLLFPLAFIILICLSIITRPSSSG
jgi:hypothetical protein